MVFIPVQSPHFFCFLFCFHLHFLLSSIPMYYIWGCVAHCFGYSVCSTVSETMSIITLFSLLYLACILLVLDIVCQMYQSASKTHFFGTIEWLTLTLGCLRDFPFWDTTTFHPKKVISQTFAPWAALQPLWLVQIGNYHHK
jgi:type IV secretory pathway VirB3-like protein